MRITGRLMMVVVAMFSVACRAIQETRPEARPELGVEGRSPLDVLPANQYFTYVSAPTLFTGVVAFDTMRAEPRRAAGFRQSLQIPLTSMGWNESVPEIATFRIAVIEADRHYSSWIRFENCYRQTFSTTLYRGFAIERVSDGAVFWRLYPGSQLDQELIEKRASDDIANFVLGRAPSFPEAEAPPPVHLRCAGGSHASVSAPQTTDRTRSPQATPPRPVEPTAKAPTPRGTPTVAPDSPRPTPPPNPRPNTDPVRRP